MLAQQERPEQTERLDYLGLKGALVLQELSEHQGNAGQRDLQVPKDRQEKRVSQERTEMLAHQEHLEQTEQTDQLGLKGLLAWQERSGKQASAGQWDLQVSRGRQETTERQEPTEMLAHQERLEQTEHQEVLGLKGLLVKLELTE